MKKPQTNNIYAYRLDDKLYINLTNMCCCSCDFCLRKMGDGVAESNLWLSRAPKEGEVISQIQQLEDSGFSYSEAVFCGYGEPTYEVEKIAELSAYLKTKGKTVRLNTNGLGNCINGVNIVPQLAKAIDVISISLNAPDAFQYQQNCHCSYGIKSHSYVLKFARLCVKAGIRTILTVLDILPYSEIQKCRAIATKIKAEFRVRKFVADNYNYEYTNGGKE